jgi:hypothetical protein
MRVILVVVGLSLGCAGATVVDTGHDGGIGDVSDGSVTDGKVSDASANAGDGSSHVSLCEGGPVVPAKTCSFADVKAALTSAPDGALVTIPAGTCNWMDATVSRKAGVCLKGAGKGVTTLLRTAPIPAPVTTDNFMIEFDCSNGKSVEVSDLTFVGNDDLQTDAEKSADYDNGLGLSNGCIDFKVHHAEFSKFSIAGLTIRGDSRGVVYQSSFLSNYRCKPATTDCYGYGVAVYGDKTKPWPPLVLGTQDAVFIEDSYFYDNRHGVASNEGSRYVFRYNKTVATDRTRDYGSVDAHGRNPKYPPGSRSWEIYNNTMETSPPGLSTDAISIRGGDGVIYGNTLNSAIASVVYFHEESGCAGTYPILNQTRDAYIWGNTWTDPDPKNSQGVVKTFPPPPDAGAPDAACVRLDRDFFLQPKPGYTPYPYPHPLR